MAYRTSTIKRGRAQKLGSSRGTIAISLARQKNDPEYKRMMKFKSLYKQSKARVERKYSSKSRALAMQKASSYRYEGKLYKLFLREQEEELIKTLVLHGLEIVKSMADKRRQKIDAICNARFLNASSPKAKLAKSLCHTQAKIMYTKIILNGAREKLEECKDVRCKGTLESLVTKSETTLKNLVIKAKQLQREIQNLNGE